MPIPYNLVAEQRAALEQLAKQYVLWSGTVHLTYGVRGPPRFQVNGHPVEMTNRSLLLLREFGFGPTGPYTARLFGRAVPCAPPSLSVKTTLLIPREAREARVLPRLALHSTFMQRTVVVDGDQPMDAALAGVVRHDCFPITEVWCATPE